MSKTIEERIDAKGVWYDSNDNCCVEYSSVVELINEQRAIDEQELKPKWISVEDRLPEPYEDVLIFVNGKVDFGYIDEEDAWNTRYVPRIQVTHWIPLPMQPI